MSTDVIPPAKAGIYEVAAEHGILAERLPIDAWADKVTELVSDEVVHDPVEDLVVALRRKVSLPIRRRSCSMAII